MHLISVLQLIICLQMSFSLPNKISTYDLVQSENDDGNTRFLVLGDWGGVPFFPYKTPSEIAVAEAMGKIGAKLNTSFQLVLGDNFYMDGVQSVTDSRFENTFEKVFTAASLQTPWYVVLGNHDHLGNASAQIDYSKVSQRWKLPDYFYTFTLWQNGGQQKLVDFIMIDTVLLCGGGNISDWDNTPPEGPKNTFVAEAYWQWVEEQLRQSNAPYLLLAGHFPVYSVAEHGPTRCLVDRLRPMLIQYRATAYFCGHDHNLQHLSEDVNGTHIDYFVVGAGDIVEDSQKHADSVPTGSLKYFWGHDSILGGFGLVEVNSTQMVVSFIEHGEKTLYQTILKPRVL